MKLFLCTFLLAYFIMTVHATNETLATIKPKGIFICPENSEYSECGANGCQNTCADPTFSTRCKGVCIEGCVCKKGYLKNGDGVCVLPENCGGCGGDPNAVFAACGDICPKTCNNKDKNLACPQICKEIGGCKCREGFVRNYLGKCIDEKECPKCGENEFFNCGSACDTTCATLGEVCPIVNIKCNEMCYCVDGYARDANYKCIPIKQCPPKKCPLNEKWDPCPQPCPPEPTCKAYIEGIEYTCASLADDSLRVCKPACRCKDGLVRNNGGTCVKPAQCCDDPNAEVVSCPNPCPGGNCESPEFADCKAPCKIRGCQCKKGYVKDANGKCILLSKCPKKCGKNEVWNPCPGYCTFDETCERLLLGFIRDCTRPPLDWKCTGRCECAKGFVRIDGNCVNPSACCTDPNAELVSCPNPCPGGTCDQPDFSPCKVACREWGCQCKKGYVKDTNGKCIPLSKCHQCGENEFFDCGSACDTTCATLGEVCPIVNIKCNEKCYCIDGYARDENNKCIPIADCPPKNCGCNEVWNPCPGYCTFDKTCPMLIDGIIPDCAEPPEDWQCFGRCECADGYVRIDDKCVKPSKCCTDPNAKLVNCPNPCPGGTCNQPEFSICRIYCKEWGCQCKEGYVKDANGKCVLLSSYPNKCGCNEFWNPCVGYCTFDKTCSMLIDGIIPDCAAPPEDWQCYGRCECAEGYVRIEEKCVAPSYCCSDPNSELVNCPNPCPGGTCDQPEFSICRIYCKEWGCQCKKGYVKDANGKCVLLSSCPKRCAENEVWNPCKPYCSFDQTCFMLIEGVMPVCAAPPDDWKCSGKCECASGYVREHGKCVKSSECCSEPNTELVNCPNPCPGGTCDQPVFSPCEMVCKKIGCQCKQGYLRNNNGTCILGSDCPNKCGLNEVWNPCVGYCTFDKTCSMLIDGVIPDCAAPPVDWQCYGVCRCAEGYVRIDDKCVKPSACCTDPNAELVSCPNPCPGGTCDQPEFAPCKAPCKELGCQCKKGYVKDASGTCILLSSCPKKCGKHEFFDCGSACDRTCATLGDKCNIINKKCVERCYCDPGYARDKNDRCIPVNDCPPRFKCGLNEEYLACPSPCPPEVTCESHFSGLQPLCPIILNPPNCSPTCRCKNGYVRNDKKKCVLPAKCCTDLNSQLVDNPNCCPGGTCAQPSFTPCKMKCPMRGCECKPGFLKMNSTNPICIPKKSCK